MKLQTLLQKFKKVCGVKN